MAAGSQGAEGTSALPAEQRLVEAFIVAGLQGSTLPAQIHELDRVWGRQPLSDRVFKPNVLASFPERGPAPGPPAEGQGGGEVLDATTSALVGTTAHFCFPDGVAFARLGRNLLRVPRFGSFVLTRADFSRLYGYSLEFWEAAPASLAERAGAGTEGAGAWSLPTSICLLCRAPCAPQAEALLRAVHAAHDARRRGSPTAAPASVAASVVHLVRNTPRVIPGGPPVAVHAAGCRAVFRPMRASDPAPPLEYGLRPLTDTLGPDALVALFAALVTERKVVFVSSHHERLCRAATAACALLYPLEWRQVWVPLLPSAMVDVLHTPFPAVLGLRLEQLLLAGSSLPEPAVWVHLDKGRVDNVAASVLPSRERRWLRAELAAILGPRPQAGVGASASGAPGNGTALKTERAVQATFLGCAVALLRDYDLLLPEGRATARRRTDAEERAAEHAVAARPARDRQFFRALYDTQMFRAFADAQGRVRAQGRLPVGLLPFERARARAWPLLMSRGELPPGRHWVCGPGPHAGALDSGKEPPPVTVPAERMPTAGPSNGATGEASSDGTAFPTRFPGDLALPAPEAAAAAAGWSPEGETVPAQAPSPGDRLLILPGDGAGTPAVRRGPSGPEALSRALSQAGEAFRVDRHRYVEDAGYRAEVDKQQGGRLAAAGAVGVGAAAAGALLCSVQ